LYGEKNVKWINRLEPVNYDFKGFWQKAGWSDDGTVHINARIDTPTDGQVLSLQSVPISIDGVAFAGDRGISRVDLSLDGGKTWTEAQMKPALSRFAWVLWTYDWRPASAGEDNIVVRTTDGDNTVQSALVTDDVPDGPTGRPPRTRPELSPCGTV